MQPVPSPCISVCQMRTETRQQPSICSGCFRNIDEIVAWGRMNDEAKRQVWLKLPARGLPEARLQWMKPHAAH